MIRKCHILAKCKALVLAIFVATIGSNAISAEFSSPILLAQSSEKKALSFDELDKDASKDKPQAKTKRKARKKKRAKAQNSGKGERLADTSEKPVRAKRQVLPTINELMTAKLDGLSKKQAVQDELLKKLEIDLTKEQEIEEKVFDKNAYLSLSIINTAPASEYRLDRTEIYIDGKRKPLSLGGKKNRGLPRNQEVFFGRVSPGCHDIFVRAEYTRLKNDLISRFQGINRKEKIVASRSFIASDGQRVEIQIEGFEKMNSLANFYRGPALRFNRATRPNFLAGAAMVSMAEVTNQGRVKIDYVTEDTSNHRLLQKSVSIDGLPILQSESHNEKEQGSLIFDAPLAEGKHRLNVTLLFAEKKWINGGANYNFRIKFDRDFFVASGHTTPIQLVGMPKGGISSNPQDTSYATATSRIIWQEDPDVFPEFSCRELEKIEQEKIKKERIKKEKDAAKKKAAEQPQEESTESLVPTLESEPAPDADAETPTDIEKSQDVVEVQPEQPEEGSVGPDTKAQGE